MILNKRNVLHRLRDPYFDVPALTPSEKQAVGLAARGYTARDIGAMLNASEEAITQRLRLAAARLGVSGKAGLVRLAWDRVIDAVETMTDGKA
jgi:DNA-binding CsgD family transcriptional regulator